jgi:hypothetical protein
VRGSRGFGGRLPHRLWPVLACALAAHGVVWRSITPHEHEAAYVHAYQPLIGVAGLVAVAAVLLVGVTSRNRAWRWPRAVPVALGAIGWIAAQESLEQSASLGHPSLFTPSASTWTLLALASLAAGLALTAVRQAGAAIVRRLVPAPLFHVRRTRSAPRAPKTVRLPRRSVLSLRLGMRAPPPVA